MGCTGGHPPVSHVIINVTNPTCQTHARRGECWPFSAGVVTSHPLTRRRRQRGRCNEQRERDLPRHKSKGWRMHTCMQSQHDQFASNHKSCVWHGARDGAREPRSFQSGLRFSGRRPEVPKGNHTRLRGRGSAFARDCRRKSANTQALVEHAK